jgi:hypothetical protein
MSPGDCPAVGITDGPDQPTPGRRSLIAFAERLATSGSTPGIIRRGWLHCIHAESGIERFKTELIKSASRVAR